MSQIRVGLGLLERLGRSALGGGRAALGRVGSRVAAGFAARENVLRAVGSVAEKLGLPRDARVAAIRISDKAPGRVQVSFLRPDGSRTPFRFISVRKADLEAVTAAERLNARITGQDAQVRALRRLLRVPQTTPVGETVAGGAVAAAGRRGFGERIVRRAFERSRNAFLDNPVGTGLAAGAGGLFVADRFFRSASGLDQGGLSAEAVGGGSQFDPAVAAARLGATLKTERLLELAAINQARMAQANPELAAALRAGRRLPRGAVPIGEPRRDLLQELSLAMAMNANVAQGTPRQRVEEALREDLLGI